MDQSRFSWPLFSLSRALTADNLDPPAGRAGVINLEVDGMAHGDMPAQPCKVPGNATPRCDGRVA